ncbi:hypothetical protein IR010_12455 [Flavobacterium sp. MR2016-29]|nr:hypothetical protein [Flavobacterium sp. MR2016-29]
MLSKIKNSLLCKCLQVLLIGYFLMSSINISSTFSRVVQQNSETHSVKGMTCNFLKKMFKCDGIPEELDETKDSKTAKLAKGILLLEYLVPLNATIPSLYVQIKSKGENYINNPIFSFGFHGKIHLPPPRIVA